MSDASTDHETVDRLVEAVLAGNEPDEGLAGAARRVRALASAPVPTEVRDRHLALIRSRLTDRPSPPVTAGPIRRRLTALAAGLATFLTLGGGGAVALAQNAQPGDPLYGLKRATERVRLAFAGEDEDTLRLTLAERRIEEAERAVEQRPELLTDALDELLAASHVPSDHAVAVLASLLETDLPAAAANRARIALAAACERIAERSASVPDACRSDDAGVTTAPDTPTDGTENPEPTASPRDHRPDRESEAGEDGGKAPPGPPESPGGDRRGGPDR